MAKTYEQLLEQAAIIRDETAAGKNTATRVGGTITDAVDYVKELKDTYAGIHAEAAEAKTEAAAAKLTAADAKTSAASAFSNAKSAVLTANGASSTANEAKTTAEGAKTAAQLATSNATAAKTIANNAANNATAAKATADAASTAAQEAKDIADSANIAAQDAKETAEGVAGTAQDAKDVADAAKTTAEQAKQSATNAFNNARDAISTANAASGTATEAKKAADEAKKELEEAVGNLNEADSSLNERIAANTTEISGVKSTATIAYNYALAAQNAAENEATARTEADTELQSQINGKQDNIDSLSKDEKAAFLVSLGLGKIGIVSQKQTWNDVGVEPAYVMNEKVEGFISIDNINSLISYGFAFNEGTGYFELNGLTDISLQEALNIVAAGKPNFSLCDFHYAHKKIRTNLPILDNVPYSSGYFGSGFSNKIRISAIAFNSDIEVFVYGQYKQYKQDKQDYDYTLTGFQYATVLQGGAAFRSCTKLEKIYILPGSAEKFISTFNDCVRLKELELVYLTCDVNLSSSAYLSANSIHIMIANANNSGAITITLHSAAQARWQASDYYAGDIDIIKEKHITIA